MPHPKQSENVYVETLEGEICIYDPERQQMHALNPTAAFVWQQCDGETAPADMAARLEAELDVAGGEKLVWMSLERLEKAHLLAGKVAGKRRYTRRDMLKLAGISLALLPVVKSIALPTPMEAQSCISNCTGGGFLSDAPYGGNTCDVACSRYIANDFPGTTYCNATSEPLQNDQFCICYFYDPAGCEEIGSTNQGQWGRTK